MRLRRKSEIAAVFVVAAVASAAISGCRTAGCTDNRNSVPLAGFRSIDTGQAVTLGSIAVAGVGAPNDSLLLDPRKTAASVYLPFRATRQECAFSFTYESLDPVESDTVSFTYVAEPRFVSEECGAMYFYRITGVSHTGILIDSVAVAGDSLVTNIERETIAIYFRTAGPDEGPEQ